MLILHCEAASGSSIALRINLVILKELNLGDFGNVDCTGSILEKVEWFPFMRVSENQNEAGYHGKVGQYWSLTFWPYCIMELLPKM